MLRNSSSNSSRSHSFSKQQQQQDMSALDNNSYNYRNINERSAFLNPESTSLLGSLDHNSANVMGTTGGGLLPTYVGSVSPSSSMIMTRDEMLHSLANRILHSRKYQYFYLFMMSLSLFCLVLSTIQTCPTGYFYFLEAVVNLIMISEVLIRFHALGKVFWRSVWNKLDVVLVLLCLLTLFWLWFGTCSTSRSWETEADTLLLVVRNGIQFARIAVLIRRNAGTTRSGIGFGSSARSSTRSVFSRSFGGGGDGGGDGNAASTAAASATVFIAPRQGVGLSDYSGLGQDANSSVDINTRVDEEGSGMFGLASPELARRGVSAFAHGAAGFINFEGEDDDFI